MGNPLKKTMVFLGLAEEELNEQGTSVDAPRLETEAAPAAAKPQVQRAAQVTPLRKVAPVRQVAAPQPARSMNEILTMRPSSYSEAPIVAESFRDGVPVILNLTRMNEAEAKQLIDFASGLTLGLRGRIERVTNKVFLLTPEHVATNLDQHTSTQESDSFFVSATA